MGARQRFQIPQGWVARGFRLEVAATTPEQPARIAQHFGARRFAYNWALAQVKANLDARAADPSVAALGWSLPALRKAWNQAKQEAAPWWRAPATPPGRPAAIPPHRRLPRPPPGERQAGGP
jgi:hypothetical protein